jgi:acetyl esterase/lipase
MLSWQAQLLKIYFRLQRRFAADVGPLDVQQERAEAETLAVRFGAQANVQSEPVSAAGVPGAWLTPPVTVPGRILFYLHGGSYIAGSIRSHRSLVTNLAVATRARALLIGYRLAPEQPFPAALEDALTAYRWLLRTDPTPSQVVVAGDSADGGLALALLLALRDQGDRLPDAAVCLSPWTDLAATGAAWRSNTRTDLLNDGQKLRQAARLYLGETDPGTPLASPLYGDLHGLPPLLIQYDDYAALYWEKYGLYSNITHQQFIQEFLSYLAPNSTILDAACGAGRYEPFLLAKGHSVIGVDQSQGMLLRAKEKFPNVPYEKIGLQEIGHGSELVSRNFTKRTTARRRPTTLYLRTTGGRPSSVVSKCKARGS